MSVTRLVYPSTPPPPKKKKIFKTIFLEFLLGITVVPRDSVESSSHAIYIFGGGRERVTNLGSEL